MKLYYWPGACSLSPHIVSREAGIELQLAQLDRAERKTQDGTVLSSVNPKNQVPVLELDNGQRLTEGPVIVQYLADQKPRLRARSARPARWTAIASRNGSISSPLELHKTFGPMFRRPRRKSSRRLRVNILRNALTGSTISLPASNT